ncbi:MAG: hypothetical protein WCW35_09750 [Bacteroidota bacterium]
MKTTIRTLFITALISTALLGQEKTTSKFSGFMFGDFFYNIARDTSLATFPNVSSTGARDMNGFQFRRIYFTYDNEISSTFSSRFRLEGTTGAPFIKDAFLKWSSIFSGSDLIFGIQSSPAFEVGESYWGFRSLEKTIMDLRGIAPARDFGVSVKGKLTSDGMVNYWVMFGNNSSINPETDKYKRFYAHIDLKPIERLRVTVYADYKMQAQINDPASTTAPKKTLGNNILTSSLFLGYAEKGSYSVGAEGFVQLSDNGYIHGSAPVVVEGKTALGISLFGNYSLADDLTIVGRYDYFDPNTASASNTDLRQLLIAGASWNVDKNVSIIPNIEVEMYEEIQAGAGKRSIDPSITGRITVHYIFL